MININLSALRAIRKSHNLTLKELAAQMQVSPSAIGMYERGQRTPDIIYLSRLAALFETPITSFVDEWTEGLPEAAEELTGLSKYKPLIEEAQQRADGMCEDCGTFAPFIHPSGLPFLEAFFLIPEEKLHSSQDIAMLCPNCCRRLQVLQKEADIQAVRQKIASVTATTR